ncbi:uncharacterized protein A1O9_00143 [Exophiala aquamarina CBS 119918]|uniref:Zn(2)-C6 fungal-type domain-containing protein n=1 Tax=Exophiala aquamarina CBS 119918 TaxID=1182545 RepID=A0A072PQL4_9EURO|nr:uncharacterized protein A1O9_00143 [Exophiala aquamarina CBS 119918]KEF62171.1 hypothetical protein A1O9_00143 [Exophiala aquamarina CBS 119918]
MKARACTKCRQWKAKCDSSGNTPGGCSRCRSLKLQCVFDASFKRVSKVKRMQQMESEIKQLRQTLVETVQTGEIPNQASAHEEEATLSEDWATQLSDIPGVTQPLPPTQYGLEMLPQTDALTKPAAVVVEPSASYKMLGNVCLTDSQIEQRFRSYFTRCHPHLPFEMATTSADEVFMKSSLLFWVICAVTSSWRIQLQLSPSIKSMVADSIHAYPRSIETAQAILILCMWPFKISGMRDDPSLMYSGIATQMCLQLGHPSSSQHASAKSTPDGSGGVGEACDQTSTLLACFIVNRVHSGYLGLPATTLAHPKILRAFEDPAIDPTLSQLGRIYHLVGEAIVAIGANGPCPTGMLEPDSRLTMIKVYGEQLSELQERYLQGMKGIVKVSYFFARLQIWSFALLDDMIFSEDLIKIYHSAEDEACQIIELCYDMNLAASPYHFRRAICYSGFVLVKILRSPYCHMKRELLEDNVERARQALSTTASSPDDIFCKACQVLEELLYLEDKKRTAPIFSRMGASMMFDMLRIYWENWHDRNMPEEVPSLLDLDAIDWGTLGL